MSHEEKISKGKIDFVWVHIFNHTYILTDRNFYDEENKEWKKMPVIMYGNAVVMRGFIIFDAISDEADANFGKVKKALIEQVTKDYSVSSSIAIKRK